MSLTLYTVTAQALTFSVRPLLIWRTEMARIESKQRAWTEKQ